MKKLFLILIVLFFAKLGFAQTWHGAITNLKRNDGVIMLRVLSTATNTQYTNFAVLPKFPRRNIPIFSFVQVLTQTLGCHGTLSIRCTGTNNVSLKFYGAPGAKPAYFRAEVLLILPKFNPYIR